MALKDWKITLGSPKGTHYCLWEKNKTQGFIGTNDDSVELRRFGHFSSNSPSAFYIEDTMYSVKTKNGNQKRFKTKSAALNFAKSYMRTH